MGSSTAQKKAAAEKKAAAAAKKAAATAERARKYLFEQQIIEKVRTRPMLYNKMHPMFKDIIAKQNAWKAIFDELGETEFGKEAESYADIWANLWSQYLAFKKRAEGRTGQAGYPKPSFRHELSMQFFDDKNFDETSMTNVELENDPDENLTVVEFDNSLNITSITTTEDTNASKENRELPAGPSKTQLEPIPETFQSRKHAKKRVALDEFETQVVKALESNEVVDEYELLGKNVAAKLRKIALKDQYAALDLQYTIFTAMMDAEKQLIK